MQSSNGKKGLEHSVEVPAQGKGEAAGGERGRGQAGRKELEGRV